MCPASRYDVSLAWSAARDSKLCRAHRLVSPPPTTYYVQAVLEENLMLFVKATGEEFCRLEVEPNERLYEVRSRLRSQLERDCFGPSLLQVILPGGVLLNTRLASTPNATVGSLAGPRRQPLRKTKPTTADNCRAPQSNADRRRSPQTIAGHCRPPQTSADQCRPVVQTSADQVQTCAAQCGPIQTSADHKNEFVIPPKPTNVYCTVAAFLNTCCTVA